LKVFITGASGFVGRHLIRLLSGSHTITGTVYPEKPEELKGMLDCDLVYLDIRDEQDVSQAVERVKPDWVFHLAAVSNVKDSWERPRETLDINLLGTLNLLEAVKAHSQEARILNISTSDVYGIFGRAETPFKEDDLVEVVNPYAFSKLNAESLGRFYVRIEGLDVVTTRSFPHTGPGQNADFVCSDWAFQIARIEKKLSEPVINIGNLQVERDYTDVRDVVKAYILLMEQGEKGETYNVCTGKATPLEEILGLLLSFSPVDIIVKVDKNKLRKTDIPLIVGSNQRICQATGWTPEILLEQTLQDLLGYWRKMV
jgi:GDP-4-dehydro-6-deoxy-D-mannose reductase